MPRTSLSLLLIIGISLLNNGETAIVRDVKSKVAGSRMKGNSMMTRRHDNMNANVNDNANIVYADNEGIKPKAFRVKFKGTIIRNPKKPHLKHDPEYFEDFLRPGDQPSQPESPQYYKPEEPEVEVDHDPDYEYEFKYNLKNKPKVSIFDTKGPEEPESDSEESVRVPEQFENNGKNKSDDGEPEFGSEEISNNKDKVKTGCQHVGENSQKYQPIYPDMNQKSGKQQPFKHFNSNINTNVIFKGKARRFYKNNKLFNRSNSWPNDYTNPKSRALKRRRPTVYDADDSDGNDDNISDIGSDVNYVKRTAAYRKNINSNSNDLLSRRRSNYNTHQRNYNINDNYNMIQLHQPDNYEVDANDEDNPTRSIYYMNNDSKDYEDI